MHRHLSECVFVFSGVQEVAPTPVYQPQYSIGGLDLCPLNMKVYGSQTTHGGTKHKRQEIHANKTDKVRVALRSTG